MIGAIIGDIVGSPYEFDNISTTRFPLFSEKCDFTDDTICTIAIADALLTGEDFGASLRKWCLRYPSPKGAYGGSFSRWLHSPSPQPYGSWGNGAAMRVSAVGYAFATEAETLRAAIASAAPTHNHPEGLIGASVVARAIFRLRNMKTPSFHAPEILDLLDSHYGPDWRKHLPARGHFDESCRGCVPLAFSICMDSDSFEEAVRNAIAYGGDSDTLGAITGALAEARWGVPQDVEQKALSFLTPDLRKVVDTFRSRFPIEQI